MARIKSFALAVVLLSPTVADALLIEGLCNGTTDATVTCDTDSGLEWLDLTETLGLSANNFLADADGWIADGWSIATGTQVDALLTTAGFTNLNYSFSLSQIPAAQLMVDLFGTTVVMGPFTQRGWGRAIQSATLVSVPFYELVPGFFGGALGSLDNGSCCQSYSNTAQEIGVWANRESAIVVSEPGTLALLGLALAGLGLAKRRNTAQRGWSAQSSIYERNFGGSCRGRQSGFCLSLARRRYMWVFSQCRDLRRRNTVFQ